MGKLTDKMSGLLISDALDRKADQRDLDTFLKTDDGKKWMEVKGYSYDDARKAGSLSALKTGTEMLTEAAIGTPKAELDLEKTGIETEGKRETRGIVKALEGDQGVPELTGITEAGRTYNVPTSETAFQQKLAREVERKKALTKAEKGGTMESKVRELDTQLDLYFQILDVLPAGEGHDRFIVGTQNLGKAFTQNTPEGVAQAYIMDLNKKLRVDIAKLKDVGNLAVVEQQAAEKLLVGPFDSAGLRAVKKGYLKDLVSAYSGRNPTEIRNIIKKWMDSKEFREADKTGATPDIPGMSKERSEAIRQVSIEELERLAGGE